MQPFRLAESSRTTDCGSCDVRRHRADVILLFCPSQHAPGQPKKRRPRPSPRPECWLRCPVPGNEGDGVLRTGVGGGALWQRGHHRGRPGGTGRHALQEGLQQGEPSCPCGSTCSNCSPGSGGVGGGSAAPVRPTARAAPLSDHVGRSVSSPLSVALDFSNLQGSYRSL